MLRVFKAPLAVICLAIATPVAAITYDIDLVLDDGVEDIFGTPIPVDLATGLPPSLRLVGTLETDGTLGTLTNANVVTYDLQTTFEGRPRTIAYSASFNFPGFASVTDFTQAENLVATADALRVTGSFTLGNGGASLVPRPSGYSSSFSGSGAEFSLRFTNSSLNSTTGFRAFEAMPQTPFVLGTARVPEPPTQPETSVVPLPATLWMMLAALATAGGIGRRRRA